MNGTNTQKYNGVAMALHWIIAILMIVMIFFGEDMIRQPREAAADSAAVGQPSLHVSLGIAVLLLTLLRIVWRLVNPSPPYPATMKPWEVTVSKITHGLFYVLLIGLPLTGWLAFGEYLQQHANLAGTQVFGLFGVPVAPLVGEFVSEVHGFGSNVAMVLLFLHVLAALKHQFIDGDGIFRRMLPL